MSNNQAESPRRAWRACIGDHPRLKMHECLLSNTPGSPPGPQEPNAKRASSCANMVEVWRSLCAKSDLYLFNQPFCAGDNVSSQLIFFRPYGDKPCFWESWRNSTSAR